MKFGIAFFIGAVLFVLVVESAYKVREFFTGNESITHQDHKLNNGGTNNNKALFYNEHFDTHDDKQKRHRRAIRQNMPYQNKQKTHKIRHHHVAPKFVNTTNLQARKNARHRIILDANSQMERRKIFSYVKDGVVHYGYNPVVPCQGWGYYSPYRCVQCKCTRETCVRRCEYTRPIPKPFPDPHTTKHPSGSKPAPHIYDGPGKDWIGPKLGCNCNTRGSELSTCDIRTGQCRCKQHYVGRICDKCREGYWESNDGCLKCKCDSDGSYNNICNERTGQCNCKPGIGGAQCNNCLPNYYGFSTTGCKECEPCNKRGHICDPDTGRCICPPYSHGEFCQLCTINAWGYEPNKGCKSCNCSTSGSLKMQCDLATGECSCRLGYTGFNCDQCEHGYFGYPRCRRCNCNYAGSEPYKAKCDKNGVCQCNEDGTCTCKSNVSGKRCDVCKEGTFGLHLDNPDGCTQCFCFGRSSKCTDSGLTWGQIRMNAIRKLILKQYQKSPPVQQIEVFEKLLTIPDDYGNVTINGQHFDSPLYWKLQPNFNGDRILSYGGYLRFVCNTVNPKQRLPQEVLNHYPLIQLRGHGKIVLEYYSPLPIKGDRYEIRLHESLWKRIYPKETYLSPRELFMVALQNVQNIFIKATDFSNFDALIFSDVILDTAIEIPGHPPPIAKGVELCECPRQYNSSSCQNPSIGFFRYYASSSVNGTILIDTFVGQARPCSCNDRSDVCDVETGFCLNCKDNTYGRYCEKCAEGYYGNPMVSTEKCEPCPCPSSIQNFAKECKPLKSNQFLCKCKLGYTGPACDRCSPGYYGQPQLPGGHCQPCNCNVEGRISEECDIFTGACQCKPGVTGKYCSQCEKPRHVLQEFKCTPCDKCTQWLLDDLDYLSNDLHQNTSFLLNGTIEPPWRSLRNIEKHYVFLNDKLLSHLQQKQLAEELIANTTINDVEKRLSSLQENLQKYKTDDIGLQNLQKDINKVGNDIHDSKNKLDDLMKTLQNFGKSHVNTQEAIKEAEKLLKEIEAIEKNMNFYHDEVLERCKEVKESIEDIMAIPMTNPETLKNDLSTFKNRLKDVESIVTKTEITKNEVELKNRANELKLEELEKAVENINKENAKSNEELADARTTMEKTFAILDDVEEMYRDLDTDGSLKKLIAQLEAREAELQFADVENLRKLVLKHVEELQRNSTEYAKLFNLSNKEIDALKASEAYANIKKFIDEASMLADEALSDVNTALDTLSPEGKDSIAINGSIAVADSERLQIRVNHQIDNLAALKQKNDSVSLKVFTLDSSNWSNGIKNREQDRLIGQIKGMISLSSKDNIQNLIKEAIEQTNRMKDIHRTAIGIEVSKDYELIKPYEKLLQLSSVENLRKLQDQIVVTRHELQNLLSEKHTWLEIIKQNTIRFNEFREANYSVTLKLQALKARIETTKKTAEGVRISLTGATCERSYRVNTLSPTVVSKLLIKFNYTMSTDPISNSLFYVNTSSNQFMNLKLQNNRLIFEVRLGNKVRKKDYVLLQSDFYTVEIKRIGEYIHMSVNNEIVEDTTSVQEDINNDFALFKASPQNLVYIGYSPDTTPGIPSCIRDVVFNNFRIGLWNFHSSQGQCLGCIRSNELTLESTYDFYSGDAYSVVSKDQQDKYANPAKFNVQFSLRTFDENALLFLAPDPEQKSYIAIYLKNGYLYYQIHYSNNEDLILQTQNRYNIGDKVRISAEKEWNRQTKEDNAVLRINDGREVIIEKKTDVDTGGVIRLKKVNYYFGGVPPDYHLYSAGATESLYTHQLLLGGLEDLKEYQLFSDDNMKKYGTIKQSGELEFYQALFQGGGYVSIKIKRLERSLVFLLNTKSPNAFILYIESTVAMALTEGKITVEVFIDEATYTLISKQSTNDGSYHLIELIRHNKKAILKIDGNIEDTINTLEVDPSSYTQTTNLYLGGVSETFSHLLKGNTLFSGEISDILIDNKLVTFSKQSIQYFENVIIGRQPQMYQYIQIVPTNFEQPDQMKPIDVTKEMKEMQNTEGCGTPLNYTFDRNAAKFGDQPFSHVLHFLKDTFWKKDYKLSISFRTYQRDGILFVSFGPKQHFNLLEVRDGKIVFKSYGKRLRSVELPQKIDDGNWYNVMIDANGVKKKRKVTISINGYKTKPLKLPRNKVTRELYIGGVSDNVTLPVLLRGNFHLFRGCIRGLTINKVPQGLVRDKNTVHHNIGQCFPHIEKGSYFGGDAYAIYNKFFRIDKILELSLEFRTADQNGILLSVSNPRNSPALSVELQNGAIVMTTDNGYGTITNVTNNLSEFALCDNHWHNVTAVYTSTEITINVDGVRKIWVQPDDETLVDELEAPLFIGGLPDYAPVGTLKMKENFKGCIRNMKIGNKAVDWLKLEKITNVLLDSCPMTT
ncbi:hypothetical protein RN001_008982 [Aquatica leii]|uniref:Uncharacterized protein n=1 Tax=Aquatica leii TaxID=1421715 RepID=A0AAN7PHZ2_9COLE|nr:hypothetical protein RN001_008982 [Aquatica leii]